MAEDITKLPKWVQAKIGILERQIAVIKEANQAFTGAAKSRVKVDVHGVEPFYLPDGAHIEFTLQDGSEIEVQFPWQGGHREFTSLQIFGNHLHGRMVVMPQVSNVVSIALMNEEDGHAG